jgi:hypothetical protein
VSAERKIIEQGEGYVIFRQRSEISGKLGRLLFWEAGKHEGCAPTYRDAVRDIRKVQS